MAPVATQGVFNNQVQVFTSEDVLGFCAVARKAASSSDPQTQALANKQLIEMLGNVSYPITFCLQVLLQPLAEIDVISRTAACQILISRVSCTTYSDFAVQVNRPESTFAELLQLLAQAEKVHTPETVALCKMLIRLICKITTAYWVDNQCFEHFVC